MSDIGTIVERERQFGCVPTAEMWCAGDEMPAYGGRWSWYAGHRAQHDRRDLLALLRETRDALAELADDTEHLTHNCGDVDCPVTVAFTILGRLSALEPEPVR